MFSKTLIASAENPAEPVTCTCRPPPGSLIRSRISSTGLRIVSDSPSVAMSASRSADVPSGEMRGSPNGPVFRSFSAFSSARSAASCLRSAAVRPPSRR